MNLGFILGVVYLMLIAAGMAVAFKRRIESTLPVAICAVFTVLYLFGLFAQLPIANILIIISVVISFVYTCCNISRDRENLMFIVTPGFFVCIVAAIFCFYGNYHRLVWSGDSFSHWALVVKNTFFYDEFGVHNNMSTTFRSYGPGVSLLLYWFERLNGQWSDTLLQQAQALLTIAFLLPLTKTLTWKVWWKWGVAAVACFIIPTIFCPVYSAYFTLDIDYIEGFIFAWLLIVYFTEKKDSFLQFQLMVGLLLLSLCKVTGLYLCIFFCLIVFVDYLLKKKTLNDRKDIVWIFAEMAIVFLTQISWKLYLHFWKVDSTTPYTMSISGSDVIEVVTGKASSYYYDVINEFLNKLFTCQPVGVFGITWSYVGWIVCLMLMGILLPIIKRDKKLLKKSIIFSLCMLLFVCLWCVGTLAPYLWSYSEVEAMAMHCDKYLSTIFYTWITIVVSFYLYSEKNVIGLGVISLFLLVSVQIQPLREMMFPEKNLETYNYNMETYGIAEKSFMQNLDKDKDRVYIISQNGGSIGLGYLVGRYELAPVNTNPPYAKKESRNVQMTYSLGEPYGKDDIWTTNYTADEWEKILMDYTYVYIYAADSNFEKQYGELFTDAVENGAFYEVVKERGNISLRKAT